MCGQVGCRASCWGRKKNSFLGPRYVWCLYFFFGLAPLIFLFFLSPVLLLPDLTRRLVSFILRPARPQLLTRNIILIFLATTCRCFSFILVQLTGIKCACLKVPWPAHTSLFSTRRNRVSPLRSDCKLLLPNNNNVPLRLSLARTDHLNVFFFSTDPKPSF